MLCFQRLWCSINICFDLFTARAYAYTKDIKGIKAIKDAARVAFAQTSGLADFRKNGNKNAYYPSHNIDSEIIKSPEAGSSFSLLTRHGAETV